VLIICLQDTESEVSKKYVASLENVLEHGVSAVVFDGGGQMVD